MPKKKVKGKKLKLSWKGQIILLFSVITALALLPTTLLMMFGMLPTMVAAFTDKTEEKTKGLTVGAMNMAGCFPFVLELWTSSHTPEKAFAIITDPLTVVIMYAAAGMGYMIDWTLTGVIATFLSERGKSRLVEIEKRQKELVERWGREVTGELPLDARGFPLEQRAVATSEDENENEEEKQTV